MQLNMPERVFLLFLVSSSLVINVFSQKVPTPDNIYGELFRDVQLAAVFPDSKTFADCVPKRDPEQIVNDYMKAKKEAVPIDIKTFVLENFEQPRAPQQNYITQEKNVVEHIKNLWHVLRRDADVPVKGGSLLPLPHPYIVPGGRFREVYYWDSYFTMLGLKESGENELIQNMIDNFAYLINTFGHIPNGNRTYYLSRSQPPFFSLMIDLLAGIKGDSVYKKYLPMLKKEYEFWMDGKENIKTGEAYRRIVKPEDNVILNRYWDDSTTPRPEGYKEDVEVAKKSGRDLKNMFRELRAGAESGIDFSSRWFADKKNIITIEVTEIIPVDLNSLLLNLEYVISKAEKLSGNLAAAQKYLQKAEARQAAIDKYCWNKKLDYYTDYNFIKRVQNDVVSPAGMYPFCIMKKTDALDKKCTAAIVSLKSKLLKPGGIQTTENNTGQQWDAPNGWAPLEWMTIRGLDRCGQKALAKDIALRWIKLNTEVFEKTGKLMEKYNVADTHLKQGEVSIPGRMDLGGQMGYCWR